MSMKGRSLEATPDVASDHSGTPPFSISRRHRKTESKDDKQEDKASDTMDPMSLFDMERRTGIASDDVEDFASRMDMISEAMEEIKNGTFDPDKCKIPGFKTPGQEEAERKERERKEEEKRQREEEKRRHDKQEEHDKWWHKAELRQTLEHGDHDDDNNNADGSSKSALWANRVLAAYKARDANDYSVWESWVPEDPVSRSERAEREAELEKLRNREFEANNPDFCSQFKEDLEKRQRSQQEKALNAEKLKHKGNASYKRKRYEEAIEHYKKALELAPFNTAVLANIAQCYLRMEQLDDCVEFCSRTLFIDPNHVKALSRRSTVLHRQKKLKEAAEDMRKALTLEPDNPDVVEQHSIIVGDYEDSMTSSQLDSVVRGDSKAAGTLSSSQVEELRFVREVLRKMNQQDGEVASGQPQIGNQNSSEGVDTSNDDSPEMDAGVSWQWAAYDLMLPFIEHNQHVRDHLRTSGELFKLCNRLCSIFDAAGESSGEDDSISTKAKTDNDGFELIVSGMLNCVAAALANTPRNQVVLFRQKEFREKVLAVLGDTHMTSRRDAPAPAMSGSVLNSMEVQASLFRVIEEAIDSKAWKQAVVASQPCLNALLRSLQSAPGGKISGRKESLAAQSRALSSSSICFTISSDASGINALLSSPDAAGDRIVAIARSIEAHRSSASPTLSNLLGFLTNMTTSEAFRAAVEAGERGNERALLVKSLLSIALSCYTAATASTDYTLSERALASLLNLSFQETSRIRTLDLVELDAVRTLHRVFAHMQPEAFVPSVCVLSRAVSLLCRLHFVSGIAVKSDKMVHCHEQMSEDGILTDLFRICEQAFASHKHRVAVTDEIWQACAQVWCHFGWCAHLPNVRALLRDLKALPLLFKAIDLANDHNIYRSPFKASGNSMERLVGNIVKVLIALEGDHQPEDCGSFAEEKSLKVLVVALQRLPDGLARKNVAILLAKLCQSDAEIKSTVKSLRGIEMMMSISQSLQKSGGGRETRSLKANPAAY